MVQSEGSSDETHINCVGTADQLRRRHRDYDPAGLGHSLTGRSTRDPALGTANHHGDLPGGSWRKPRRICERNRTDYAERKLLHYLCESKRRHEQIGGPHQPAVRL